MKYQCACGCGLSMEMTQEPKSGSISFDFPEAGFAMSLPDFFDMAMSFLENPPKDPKARKEMIGRMQGRVEQLDKEERTRRGAELIKDLEKLRDVLAKLL